MQARCMCCLLSSCVKAGDLSKSFVLWAFCGSVVVGSLSSPLSAENVAPLTASAAEKEIGAVPRLVVPEPVFSFGTVRNGEKVEHTFIIKNEGSAPLTVRRVQPACGCTIGVIEKNTLAPGEETKIQATFDSTGFRGEKKIPIRLYTNDPKQAMTELLLRGEVKQDVDVRPQQVSFGVVRKSDLLAGKVKKRSVTIFPDPATKVSILDVHSRSEELELETQDVTERGLRGKRILVGLKPGMPVGLFRGSVVIKTTSSANTVLNVPVLARVEGVLRFEPTNISYGLVEGPTKDLVQKKVVLINESSEPLSIKSFDVSDKALQVKIVPLQPGKRYEVEVAIRPGYVGMLRGEVKFVTSHDSVLGEPLVLRVYGIVAEKGA